MHVWDTTVLLVGDFTTVTACSNDTVNKDKVENLVKWGSLVDIAIIIIIISIKGVLRFLKPCDGLLLQH